MGTYRNLEWFLDPKSHPLPTDGDHPFWNRPDPKPHWSDQGENDTAIQSLDAGLRFALHKQLIEALGHYIDLEIDEQIKLDFRHAEIWDTIPAQNIYGVSFQALKNVQRRVETGTLYTGNVAFIYDKIG